MTHQGNKTICFFGLYDQHYSRNAVLRSGLEAHGWRIIDCQIDPRKDSGLKKYWKLAIKFRQIKKEAGVVLVAHPGQTVLWLAKIFAPKKKIIFDAFTSLYDSNVFDRQRYGARSLFALKDYFFDWLSWRLADLCLTDTAEDLKYWQEKFGYRQNCLVVFVGSKIEEVNLSSNDLVSGRFVVHFHGHYILLQGVQYIVGAAKILSKEKDIFFRLIGEGQEYEKIQRLVKEFKISNIEFLPKMDFENLKNKMAEADIVLGIFGSTPKAKRVIPNKVFEGLALGKPVLTAESPAILELLTDNVNVALCPPADSEALAQKILFLKGGSLARKQIGENARRLYNGKLRPDKIVSRLSEALEDYVV